MKVEITDAIVQSLPELFGVLSKRFFIWLALFASFSTFWATAITLAFSIAMLTVIIKDSKDSLPIYVGADVVLGAFSIGAYTAITDSFLIGLVAIAFMYFMIYSQELGLFRPGARVR